MKSTFVTRRACVRNFVINIQQETVMDLSKKLKKTEPSILFSFFTGFGLVLLLMFLLREEFNSLEDLLRLDFLFIALFGSIVFYVLQVDKHIQNAHEVALCTDTLFLGASDDWVDKCLEELSNQFFHRCERLHATEQATPDDVEQIKEMTFLKETAKENFWRVQNFLAPHFEVKNKIGDYRTI